MTLPGGPGSWQQVSGILLPPAEDGWRGLKIHVSVVRFPPLVTTPRKNFGWQREPAARLSRYRDQRQLTR